MCSFLVLLLYAILCGESLGQSEKSSLTFVIDDTGSMGDDIAQVKDGVNMIFDAVANSNDSQIGDFVLVTINDPNVQFRTATKSREEFKKQLASISVNGGGDCPEMAMTGIETALASSKPGSLLYVFTDASAKDSDKINAVQAKAIKAKSSVVFLLTGRCSMNDNDPAYQVYYKLAEATSGQVFHMTKQNVKEILKYIVEQIESPKTFVTSKKFPPGSNHSITFPVDSDMPTLIISESGKDPTIDVRSPDGGIPDAKKVVDLPDVLTVRIDDTIPGNYTAVVGSKSEASVLVTATSSIRFKHGFSGVQATNIGDTATRPISGEKTYVSIKLITPDDNKILESLEILDIEENVRDEMPLSMVNAKEKFYTSPAFLPPEYLFKILIKGTDKTTNKTFRRISQTPIQVQRPVEVMIDPKAPVVMFNEEMAINADFNGPLKIACKVTAYPKPDIIWVDEAGASYSPTVSAVELPYDYISILNIEKVTKNSSYTCKASNTYGEYSKRIDVITVRKEYFNIIEVPKDVTIEYGKSGSIVCNVDAMPPASITWFSNGAELHTNKYIEISSNGSVLTVKDMQLQLNKSYSCLAKNEGNDEKFDFRIVISGFEQPEILEAPSLLYGIKGNDTEINCRIIRGSPKPVISWYFKPEVYRRYLKLNNTDEVLRLRELDFPHEGIYACLVSNAAGVAFKETTLTVSYAPTIDKDVSRIKSRHGEPTTLKCVVHGVPKPKVKWLHDGIGVISDEEHHIYRDHSLKFKGSISNSGKFVCTATNFVGTATRTVQVDYVVPVAIDPPKVSTLEMNVGDHMSLPCRADGYPKPTIKWIFYNKANTRPITIWPSDESGSLNLNNLQPRQDGYYTCVARNPDSSANVTYHITVLAKPIINKNSSRRSLTVVTHDLAHMIPCQVTGNPKPEITWTRNGLNIPAGTEWYDIKDDGTLTIKNIDEKSGGRYVCRAKNKVGEDTQDFHVTVRPYPDLIAPTETVNLQENSTADLVCNVPHTRLDYIRWYKDRRLISEGEKKLRNVKISDAGVYICRVSTFSQSTSSAVRVVVGTPPSFADEAELKVNFEPNNPAFLDCLSYGEPAPEVIWLHNGKRIGSTKMLLEFEMTSETRGNYECIVSNQFGNINRNFEIVSRECFLNIQEDFTRYQPLMVEPRFIRLPQFDIDNGYIRIPAEETLLLYCPSGFSNIPQSEVIATCKGDTKFNINGNTFRYSDLQCQEEVTPQIRRTGKQCKSANDETVLVGFEVRGVFLNVYEICMNKDTSEPVYAKTRINRSVADVNLKNDTKWFGDELTKLNFKEIYDCDRQINYISSRLRKWFHSTDRCCFGRRMLVDPRDLSVGISQKTAYTYINVVPQWSTCGTENWNVLEVMIRKLAQTSYDDLEVWTGTSGQLALDNDITGDPVDIQLSDATGSQQSIPQYLWKVVQNPATSSSVAIVQLNIPDLDISEALTYMVCRDICRDLPWMAKHMNWRDPSKGYTFCCSLPEFEAAFHMKDRFGNHRKILHIATLPSLSFYI